MGVLNYEDFNQGDNDNPDLFRIKRIGLWNVDYKRGILRGRNINEATTEHLAQYILERIYKDEWLLDYKAPWISYENDQKIVDQLIETDGISLKWEDFYKAMLLRKTNKDGKVEINTPLYELIAKSNGLDNSKKIKRPSYYQLIMDILDAGCYKEAEEFIKSKDINVLRNSKTLSWNLTKYFGENLLNKNGTDFNEEILNSYAQNALWNVA